MMTLHHLAEDKIHAKGIGPYSIITQQPVGERARKGGQRLGYMEVWALEAHGASAILQEMLTVKSDDTKGRKKIYNSIIEGTNLLEPGTPTTFEVLRNELKGLAFNIEFNEDDNPLR